MKLFYSNTIPNRYGEKTVCQDIVDGEHFDFVDWPNGGTEKNPIYRARFKRLGNNIYLSSNNSVIHPDYWINGYYKDNMQRPVIILEPIYK